MADYDLRLLAAQWAASGLNRRDFMRLTVRGVSAASIAGILAACGASPTPTLAPSTAPSAAPSAAPSTAASAAPSAAASAAPSAAAATATRAATAGTGAASAAPSAAAAASPTRPATAASPTTAAAAPTANPNAPKGGTLNSAAVGDIKSFHLYQTTDTASSGAQGLIYGAAGLTQYDPDTLQLVGLAAQKIELSDDKKTVTFTLRDMKWSDGSPITTDDYIWTYQQASNPDNKWPYIDNLMPIASYTAKDAKTIVVTLKEARTTSIEDADAVTPLPKAIWSKYPWGDPVANPEINAPTVCSGEWKLKEWKKDQSATYVANENCWRGRPNIDTYVIRQYGNEQTAYQALKSGEVDVYGPPAANEKEAEGLSNLTVYKWYNVPGQWSYLGYNFRRKPLMDVLVRRAINYAVDRQGIIDAVAYGLGKPIYSAYTQDDPVYNPNVEHYDFNPQKSADLFKQAGYTLQNKKLVKDGQPLKFKLLFGPGTSKVREGIATVVQQQLNDLGADVEVVALEFQAYLDTISSEPFDYDLFVLGWSATTNPYYSYQIWAESSIPDLNSGAYVNKDVDKLFQDAVKEFDDAKRKAIYFQIQKLITDDAPYAFIYNNQSYVAINKRIGGVRPTRRGTAYDNFKDWYIQK